MAKFQLPTSTKGGSKGFAPPRKTATKTAPRPKARPLAPARFESKPPPPPPQNPVGAWACLYAKKGPKKKITWLDGEVVREPYPGNMHRVRLVDADTKAQVTSTTKPASLAPFEVDKDDETCFSGYRLQITARLRGGGPAAAPAAPPAPARRAPRAPVRPAPPRPKPRPAPAPAAPPPPSGRAAEVGAWACLYAKKGPKKRIPPRGNQISGAPRHQRPRSRVDSMAWRLTKVSSVGASRRWRGGGLDAIDATSFLRRGWTRRWRTREKRGVASREKHRVKHRHHVDRRRSDKRDVPRQPAQAQAF